MLKSRRRDKTHNFAQIFAPGTQLSLVQHFKGVNISFLQSKRKKANDETSEIVFNWWREKNLPSWNGHSAPKTACARKYVITDNRNFCAYFLKYHTYLCKYCKCLCKYCTYLCKYYTYLCRYCTYLWKCSTYFYKYDIYLWKYVRVHDSLCQLVQITNVGQAVLQAIENIVYRDILFKLQPLV